MSGEAAKVEQDRRGSLWKQRATISLRRASLWREEASRSVETEDVAAAATPHKRPLKSVHESDYFQELEEAVKRRRMLGMRMSDLPPLLSPEHLFTQSIPSGINSRVYCRAPSNRIGIYFSPETMEMGDMRASDRLIKRKKPVPTSYEKPEFKTVKRPQWRSSDTRPKHCTRCFDPALDSPEFEHELPKYPEMPKPPRRRNLRVQVGSPLFTSYFSENEDDEEYRTCSEYAQNQGELLRVSPAVDSMRMNTRVVESPRSMHTLAVESPTIPPNMMKVAEDILRYQFYVESGVDDRFIAPMRERWPRNAVEMVGKYVKRGLAEHVIQATIVGVLEEVQQDYMISMRKAIVDYVLQVCSELCEH